MNNGIRGDGFDQKSEQPPEQRVVVSKRLLELADEEDLGLFARYCDCGKEGCSCLILGQ